MNKSLIAVLVIFALVAGVVFSSMDVSISNSYQRAVTAGFFADFIKHDLLKVGSLAEIKEAVIRGHEQYKIFSGIADWTPLQVILLTLSFLVFGINKFSLLVIPLVISVLALLAVYRLARLNLSEKGALITVILAAVSTFFFYSSAAPFLENGVVLFTALCIHALVRYMDTRKEKFFYWSALFFALGFLYHILMVFVAPALVIVFFMKTPRKQILTKKTFKMVGCAIGIVVLVLIPLLAREAVLIPSGTSPFSARTLGRLKYSYEPTVDVKGFLFANDFEFENELPKEKRELIVHRYQLTYLQKFVTAITSIFYHWILIPFILLGIFARRKKGFLTSEIILLIFVLTSLVFFSTNGVLPRYTIPAATLLFVFAARGLLMLPRKLIVPAFMIVLLVMAAQTTIFFVKVYQGDHVQSMQHNYDSAAQFVLDNSSGEFTVITTRLYQMSFAVLEKDVQKRAYVELAPQTQKEFDQMLQGNFTKPALLQGSSLAYSTKRPKVKYVIVHEQLETGPLKDTADYNLREVLEADQKVHLADVIDSPFPRSKTWIYEVANTDT